MKSPGRARVAALLLALAGGGLACAHAKTTEAEQPQSAQKSPPAAEDHSAKRAAAEPASKSPTAIPVVGAPEGLLEPGAEPKIRDKLAAGGFLGQGGDDHDASLREGLRRFQRAHDLPATGTPDHETVKKLGLDPNQIFRHAQAH
jgi:putative peptidoglycan binding protein